ncbi:MAG: ABC transporter permease [Christensenellaceae bacterium]
MYQSILKKCLVLLFWLGVWQLFYMLVGQEILFSSPLAVFTRLFSLVRELSFWKSIGASLLRVAIGYLLGVLVGIFLAVISTASKMVDALLSPLLTIIRATPVASFIILVLFWLTTDMVPVFIGFLIVVGIIWANVKEGILRTDPALLEMASIFRFSRSKKLRYIYIPSVRPFFSAASLTALGLAWKSSIAAEVICHPSFAIGSALYNAKIYLETTDLLAWTFMVILLSMILEKMVEKIVSARIQKGGE